MPRGRRVVRSSAVLRAAGAGLAAALALGGCGDDGGGEASGPVLTIQATPAPSTDGPEARVIRKAFAALEAADLPAENQRDGTDACEQLACFTRIVSDEVTISAWQDADAAAEAAERNVKNYGVTFVTSRVPRDGQARYLRVIRDAIG